MRKRPCRIHIYFTEKELEALDRRVAESKVTREEYCRNILKSGRIMEAPPVEYHQLITEVKRVGNNLNQVLHRANQIGLIDDVWLKEVLDEINVTLKTIRDAFSPKRGD